jgi:anti-sigma regulatory factor (Ser/Thr protein kinase)
LRARHAVTFYRDAGQLADEVARFLAAGLAAGEPAIVIATPKHCAMIADALGASYAEGVARGCYFERDAATTLARFHRDGAFDRAAFAEVIGGLLDTASTPGHPPRVYGEMVALLWDVGDVESALTLESMWNELAEQRTFCLLCGYPAATIAAGETSDAAQVCHVHDNLHVGDGAHSPAQLLFPVASAVSAARAFVVAVLEADGRHTADFVADAALVATELAANAVKHARTPFRIAVQPVEHGVRITAEDGAGNGPQPRTAASGDTAGRGLQVIGSIAPRWGWDTLPEGKVVWAELDD